MLIRSRLVARDFKSRHAANDVDVFRGDASSGGQEVVAPHGGGQWRCGGRREARGCVVDVKNAHLNGRLNYFEFDFVSLPDEVGGGVGRLRR